MTTKDVNAAIWAIEAPESVKRGILGPMYTRSIDASMAVIAAKFDVLSSVELFVECDRSGTVTNRCATLNTNCGDVFVGRADTYAHALAIALLAALEAEQ